MAAKPAGAAQGGGALDKLPPIAKVGVGFLFVFLVGLLYFVLLYGDVDNDLTAAQAREAQLGAILQIVGDSEKMALFTLPWRKAAKPKAKDDEPAAPPASSPVAATWRA